MKYIVIEIQTTHDGSVSHIENVYDSRNDAEQKFHQILSYAAVSNLRYHSAVILNDCGEWIKGETYSKNQE